MKYPFKERLKEKLVIYWFEFIKVFYNLRKKKNHERIREIELFLLNWNKNFDLIANNKLSPEGKVVEIKEMRIYDIIDIPEVNKNKNILKEFIIRHRTDDDNEFIDEYHILRNIEEVCDGKGKGKNIGSIYVHEVDSYIRKININFIDSTLRYALVEYVVYFKKSGKEKFAQIIEKNKNDYKSKHLIRYRFNSPLSVSGWHISYPELRKYKEKELQRHYLSIKKEVNNRFAMCYDSLFQKFRMENPALVRLDTDIETVDIQYKNFWRSIGIDERNSFYQKDNKVMVNYGFKFKKNYTFHMISNSKKDGPLEKIHKDIIYSDKEFGVIIKSIYLDCLLFKVNKSIQDISQDYSKMNNKRVNVDKKLLRFQIEKYKLGDIFEEFSIDKETINRIECTKLKDRIKNTEKEFDKRMQYYSQLQKRIGEMINVRSISEQKKLNKTSRMLTGTIISLSILALLGSIRYDVDRNYLEYFLGRVYKVIIKPLYEIFIKPFQVR